MADSFLDLTVSEFTYELSGNSPTPGGGGAAALAGALAAALGGMVTNLTIGKEKYAEYEEEMLRLRSAIYLAQKELLEQVDGDAAAFEPLAGALRMVADTAYDKLEKERVKQAALKGAADVPKKVMQLCARTIELLEKLSLHGSKLAMSDVACGAALAAGAMRSAHINLLINTKLIDDEAYALKENEECARIAAEYLPRAEALYTRIYEEFDR